MKRNIIFCVAFATLATFLPAQDTPLRYRVCDNCSTQEGGDNLNTAYTYGGLQIYGSQDVTSDFGARYTGYDWHKGIDFRPLQFAGSNDGGRGTAVVAAETGDVFRITATQGFKYIVIDGEEDFGYGHIFNSRNPTNTYLQSGSMVLKAMDSPFTDFYAILNLNTSNAIGQREGTVTLNGTQYDVEDEVTSTDQTIAAMGGSGGGYQGNDPFPVHLHLYHFQDINNNPLINEAYETNCLDPLHVIQHEETSYEIKFHTEGENFGDVSLNYPGSSPTKFRVRAVMENATNTAGVPIGENGSATRYGNVVMNLDNIQLLIKPSHENEFQEIRGKEFYSRIRHGALDDNEMYPTYLALNNQRGNWNHQSIAPFAYTNHPYDDFYFTDFITRIHKDDPMDGEQAQIANCPDNARYNDGIYEIKTVAIDVRNSDNKHESEVQKFILDNFQPFLSSFTFNTGFLQFTRSWSCYACGISLAPNPMLEANQMDWNAWLQNPFWQLSVQASEPLEDLTLDILVEGNLLQEDIQGASSPNGIDWVFDLSQYASQLSGRVEFLFFGYDTNGNTLLAFSPAQQSAACLQVPTRNGANSWDNPDQIPSGPDNVFAVCLDCGGGGVNKRSPENEGCAIIELVPDSECLEVDGQITSASGENTGDGSINLTIAGGVPPYQYLWADGSTQNVLEDLNPGEYCVTITDELCCFYEKCLAVEVCAKELSIIGEVEHMCADGPSTGTIDITVLGGGGSLTYLWNTGQTTQDLNNIETADTYYVTVTDACGNSETQPFDVGIFFGASLDNYIHHPTSCNSKDGDIDISFHGNHPEGGVPPYTYQWSTGEETANITGLGAGTYILTITDSEGCAETFTFNLVPEGSPRIILTEEITPSCEGENNGAIEISVYTENAQNYPGQYPAYEILWYNSSGQLIFTDPNNNYDSEAAGLPPDSYTVTVRDISDINVSPFSGCISSATFVVEERPSLGPFTVAPQITPSCYGDNTGSIYLNTSGGNPPYTYNWDNGEHTQSIDHLSSPASYSVTITDDCGRQIVHAPLSVPSYSEIINTIVSEGGCPGMIELETSGGSAPYTYLWSNGQTSSTATGLINGIGYQVTVSDANGCNMAQHFDVPIDEEEAFEIFISNLTVPSVPNATNGSITVAADPAGNYSYLWSNGVAGASVEGLGLGSHTVTATDSDGCSVARMISLQSCYNLPGAPPNFSDFEILATGGLFSDISGPETTVTASIREEGETFFTEDIPGNYSISWQWGNGTVIGNTPSLTLELSSVPGNSQLFTSGFENLWLVVSNGCVEKRIYHYLMICGEEILNEVVSQFFVLEPSTVQPCRGFQDGTITLEIPNPNLQEVSVFRDGIELPVAGEGALLLVEETGLGAGGYNYQINIGNCTFNFLYSMKVQAGDLVFNHYDSEQRTCLYDEFCDEQHVGIFQESPFFDVDNASSFPCAVPLFCGLPPNDIFVGYETASPRRVRAAEYFRILQQLRNHPDSPYPVHYIDGLIETARARFDECDKLRYCPASLDWISETITNGNVSDVSVFDDGFCTHVTCQSFLWNFSFSVCDNDLDFPSDLLNTSLDFEGNTCMPVTANLFELYLAWKNGAFEESGQFEGSALEEELALLDGASDDMLNRSRCATISYCNRDLNTVWNNTINDVECGYFIITGEYNPRVFYDVGFNYEPIPMCQPIPHYDPVTEEITHETVHCRVGDGYRTKVILYDYSPPPPPQLNRGPVGITTKKFVTDTFYIEKLSNFALHIDEGQRAPKGILDTDYDEDLYFDFNDKAYIVHKSKLPNTAFHIDDWDKDQTLFCTIIAEDQAYEISYFDSLPRWESSLRTDGELKIEHFSKTGYEVVIGGFATGALEFNNGAIANLGNRTGFIARLSLTNGTLTAISTIENINPHEQLLFSENENEIIYFTGGYVDGAIGLDGNNINMSGDSGIFVIKFEIPGQFTLVADIENGTLFDVKKISQSQAEGEFTLALSSIGGNSITIHNNGNQEQVQLEEEASLLILAFDENETLAWHKAYPTENLDLGHFSLANGENGDVFLGLTFSGALNDTLVSAGEKDIAILKLNATGSTQWANAYGSVEDENVSQLMYDNGILFFGGEFSGSTDRIIGPYEFVNVTPYDSSRAYISLIDERTPPASQDGPYENASYSANSQYAIKGSNPIEVTAIFPNPFNNAVHVGVNCERSEVVFVEMFNLLGKKILHYEEEVSPGRTTLKVLPDHTLNNGIYHLKISSRSFPEGSLHKIVKMARY